MSDIDRFDWVADSYGDYYMSASPSGHWVKFEAHEAELQARREALERSHKALLEAIRNFANNEIGITEFFAKCAAEKLTQGKG